MPTVAPAAGAYPCAAEQPRYEQVAADGGRGSGRQCHSKDLAAARLALDLEADVLLILTDVAAVFVGYKTPGQRALAHVTVEEMERHTAAGEFKAGSMGAKVAAALQFARAGGRAVIASLLDVAPAMRGEAGTTIEAAQ
jgi:carbamate kinase